MRRFSFQCWSVIFLLVSRLVFGEFAHASSHEMHMAAAVTEIAEATVDAAQPQEHCGEHAGGQATDADAMSVHGGSHDSAPAHDAPAHDASCCDTGACECLCVHISAAATPTPSLHLVLIDQGHTAILAAGLAQDRPCGLFRPPA